MSTTSTRNNLPAELTSFIGRQTTIGRLRSLARERRLVTLVGVGGSGKTRLAIVVARELVENHPGGVWFVDLAPISNPGLVGQAVGSTFGLRPPANRSAEEHLIEHLGKQEALLVLDNCEHLLSACTHLVDAILRRCPGLHVLATSREPLRVEGEVTWRVPPLALPQRGVSLPDLADVESIRLFVERARAVMPDFDLTPDNALAVAEVCQRLDGLPLALELAAVRVQHLTPGQIATKLDDRFRLLARTGRVTKDRHRSLVETVAWSYDLLSEPERRLFRRLAVFVGSFDLEAAEAVCSAPPLDGGEVFDIMAGLIDKSLLFAAADFRGDRRYKMLETVREYALVRLKEDEDFGITRERHGRLFAAICTEASDRLQGPDAGAWYELLEQEMDNLRAALAWATANERSLALRMASGLAGFWDSRGWLAEGRQWLRTLLEPEERVPTAERAAALAASGMLAWRQSEFPEARRLFTAALVDSRAINDTVLVARAASGLGDVLFNTGDGPAANACYEEALQLFREQRDMLGVARALSRIGGMRHFEGRFDASDSLFQESLAISRHLNDRLGVANQLYSLGMNAVATRRYSAGRKYLRESLTLREELGDPFGNAWARIGLAIASTALGDPSDAREHFRECVRQCEENGDRWGLAMGTYALAGLLAKTRLAERAFEMVGASLALRQAVGGVEIPWFRVLVDDWLVEGGRSLATGAADLARAVGATKPATDVAPFALACLEEVHEQLQASKGLISRREQEVARLVANGLTNRDIAERLFISERTVDGHVQKILAKLAFRSRAQIAGWIAETR